MSWRCVRKGVALTVLLVGVVSIVFLHACGQRAAPPTTSSQPNSESAPKPPDPREIFELREKCAHEALLWFKELYGSSGYSKSGDTESRSDYTNHYNLNSNRCFALVSSTNITSDSKTHKMSMAVARSLVDVQENRTLGDYFKSNDLPVPTLCSFGESSCTSQIDWEQHAKPYMED